MTPKIEIRIYPTGLIESKSIGIKGKNCLDYLPLLEDVLQAETVMSSFTAEYQETTSTTTSTQCQKTTEQDTQKLCSDHE